MTDLEQATLESLVDGYGLANVLRSIASICDMKAEHLRANWQDANAARTWERLGKQIDRVADKAWGAGVP